MPKFTQEPIKRRIRNIKRREVAPTTHAAEDTAIVFSDNSYRDGLTPPTYGYPEFVETALYRIENHLEEIDPYVVRNLKKSRDFLTSLISYRSTRSLEDMAENHLLEGLSRHELWFFRNWIPMVSECTSFEKIDFLYRSESNGQTKTLSSERVFTKAHESISDPKKRGELEKYVSELERVYLNLREVLDKYHATKEKFKFESESPFFGKLIDIYTSTQDPFILNVIVPPFLRFAKKVTENTMRGISLIETGAADNDDYFMAGVSRIVDDLYRFQPWRNLKITTFLGPRIAGGIIDEARSLDMLSRGDRKKVSQFRAIMSSMRTIRGSEKIEDEIAEEMGITSGDLREIIMLNEFKTVSLETPVTDNNRADKVITLGERLAFYDPMDEFRVCTPENDLLRKEKQDLLLRVVSQLSEEQRKLFHAYYVLGMTQKEIGQSGYLGRDLSEARISQLVSETRIDLKKRYDRLINS